MNIPEEFRDPGTVLLAAPLAGSIFDLENIPDQERKWPEQYQYVLETDRKRDSMDIVKLDDLPTFYSAIRMAPIAILMPAAWGISSPLSTEFLKLRVCEVSLNISADICAHINELQYKREADLVVHESAHYQLFQTLLGGLLPVFFSLFVGSWSDRFGRKLPMIIPFLGFFCASVYIAILSSFLLSPAYLLVVPILTSITGGWTIILMAQFSYIGDYTTDKTRSLNIAVTDGFLIVCGNISAVLGGMLFEHYGFQVPFYLVACLYGTSFLYILLVIRDRIPRDKGASRGCNELISISHLKDNLRMLRRERIGSTRVHIYILLFTLLLYSICESGDDSVTQLFVEFQPFSWTVSFYTIFSCVSGLAKSTAIIVCMLLFRRLMTIPDTLIAFIGGFSAVLYFFGFGIAWSSWVLYVAAGLGCLRTLVVVCIRSLLSSMVDKNEIGKIMSLISSLQALTPLFGAVIFTTVFAETSSWYSGLCFLIAAFPAVLIMAAFGYVDVVRRRPVYAAVEPLKADTSFA